MIALLMQACSSGYAPVYEQSLGARSALPPVAADEYRVRPGDTLIAIAFRLGMDDQELARINGIRNPDRIFSGQVLKTRAPVARSSTSAPSSRSTAPSRTAQVSTTRQTAAPAASQTRTNPAPARASSINWNWPHTGKLLARFDTREGGNKGLDLSGRIGDPIKAAADGEVVYAGSGLLGYGNLVIISHNRDYLSAYAHNSRILVSEKQKVKAGQIVAELGNTGASVPMLHFEIRRDGKPVDPLGYLPRR